MGTPTLEEVITLRAWTRRLVILGVIASAFIVIAWMRRPLLEPDPILPSLATPPAAPAVRVVFPEGLFRSTTTVRTSSAPAGVDVASKATAQWVVKGVDIGPPPRAYLADAEGGRSVWVSEGDRAGPYRVKRIESGQVLVESEDGEAVLRF
ncbi:MAG: hypothetical protein HY594_04725 [Candidatus Omnitrophica bacterium]|nr:hypothetical protein [Candidatus Omnitrophota bacterium]